MTIPASSSSAAIPNSWLVPAILTTVCCMPVTGVVAVYYAAQVKSYWRFEDYRTARMYARRARAWVFAGLILYVIVMIWGMASGTLFDVMTQVRL